MKKLIFLIGIVIIITVLTNVISYFLFGINFLKTQKTVKFNGIVNEIKDYTSSDGNLTVKIDNKWITVSEGGLIPSNMKRPPRGQIIGVNTIKELQGKKVEVYAKEIDKNQLTIYGSKDYFIKIIK